MIHLFFAILTALPSFATPLVPEKDLSSAISIIRRADGQFDVLCSDHSREIVSQADLQAGNLCPNSPGSAPGSKLDLLFVVDNSGSMEAWQSELSGLARQMIAQLTSVGLDFQIGVTTTDAYDRPFLANNSGHSILTPNTPYLARALKRNLLQGTQGSSSEMAFESFRATLQSNSHFLRSDAFLHIVILGDEDDQSNGTVQEYINFLDSLPRLNPAARNYKVSAISVFDENCEVSTNQPQAARMREMLTLTGGNQISICSITSPL